MKISRILLPLTQMLEAVTKLVNTQFKRSPLPYALIPVRNTEVNRLTILKSREAERRYNQGNN